MRVAWIVRRVLLALLLMGVAGYLSVLISGPAAENRVAKGIADAMRKEGKAAVYVWPSVAPDSVSILERNGAVTRLCTDTGSASCYPQAYMYRSVAKSPFVVSVRWQYSRDHHGVGGTRRFLGLFGLVHELSPERTFIQ